MQFSLSIQVDFRVVAIRPLKEPKQHFHFHVTMIPVQHARARLPAGFDGVSKAKDSDQPEQLKMKVFTNPAHTTIASASVTFNGILLDCNWAFAELLEYDRSQLVTSSKRIVWSLLDGMFNPERAIYLNQLISPESRDVMAACLSNSTYDGQCRVAAEPIVLLKRDGGSIGPASIRLLTDDKSIIGKRINLTSFVLLLPGPIESIGR